MDFYKVKWLIPGALIAAGVAMDFSMASDSATPVKLTPHINERAHPIDAGDQSENNALTPPPQSIKQGR